jgi:hypothetical protein
LHPPKKPGFYNNLGGVTEMFHRNPVSGCSLVTLLGDRYLIFQKGDRFLAPGKETGNRMKILVE